MRVQHSSATCIVQRVVSGTDINNVGRLWQPLATMQCDAMHLLRIARIKAALVCPSLKVKSSCVVKFDPLKLKLRCVYASLPAGY
jgi:hypothetical protein